MKRIFVSSNCQTNGIASVLEAIFPEAEVAATPLPWPFDSERHSTAFANKIAGFDVWVTTSQRTINESILSRINGKKPLVIPIPAIGFSAFHPDLCYVQDTSTGCLTNHHYNSAIAAWAYRKKISIENTVDLFNKRTFFELGYFDQWNLSVGFLRDSFINHNLEHDFKDFFLNIQRTGCFMHSINHPMIHVLARLGKVISTKMGKERDVFKKHLELEDELNKTVWPLYPEVADELSLPEGCYTWKFGPHHIIDGVRNYIEFSFRNYVSQAITAENIEILNRDCSLLDRVLNSRLGLTK